MKKTLRHWESLITEELHRLWQSSDRFLPCHGPEHHQRVWQMAKPFGRKHGADLEVLLAGCLFHDVAAFQRSIPADHDLRSATIAKRILRKVEFPAEKIQPVVDAIMFHRSKTVTGGSLEGQIIKSFDKIDAFGPTGVYRIIAPLSIRGYGAEAIVQWAVGDNRLEKKWRAIAFPELRRRYRDRYQYTRRFFRDLAKQLGVDATRRSKFSEHRLFAK